MSNGYNGSIATSADKIVDHGSNAVRWNLVILGEGYSATELPKYHADVAWVLDALKVKSPFDDLWTSINVFSVDVISTESFLDARVDVPRQTYYNSYFVDVGPGRVRHHMDGPRAFEDGIDLVPEAHVVIVLINFTAWTIGHAGSPAVACVQQPDTFIHEIGHMLGLADEYIRVGTGTASGPEPPYPNVTFNADRATIKWRDLIHAETPVPSSCAPASTVCAVSGEPVTMPGVVGAFEGAYYHEFGSYRPTLECCMRWREQPFCSVCDRVIRQALEPFRPDPLVTSAKFVIDSPNVHTNYKKVIRLRGDFGVARFYFVPDNEPLGVNRKRTDRDAYDIYFPMTSWPHFVDLLRNEKPVYFYYDAGRNTAVVKTNDEPVGEQEA